MCLLNTLRCYVVRSTGAARKSALKKGRVRHGGDADRCAKEGVHTLCLPMADRCGKMLALGFSSSLGAWVFEQDFKRINFDGKYAEIWSHVKDYSPRAPRMEGPLMRESPSVREL